MTDEDLPALFRRADGAAMRGQKHFVRATKTALGSTVVAAGFGVVSLSSESTDWAAVIATAAFVLTIIVTVFLLSEKPEREWYEGRAGAESAKTLAWRYSVGGADFEVDVPRADADADAELIGRLRAIVHSLQHVRLGGASGGEAEITPAMRALRASDYETRKRTYRRDRIADQRSWYATQATKNQNSALRWRLASLGFQLFGVVGGVLRATGAVHVDLLGIAAAATAAVLAWLQTKDYATLGEAYSITEQELGLVDAELASVEAADWPAAVDNAEQAVSREHTLWRARRATLDASS
jgi:hypothetical protein